MTYRAFTLFLSISIRQHMPVIQLAGGDFEDFWPRGTHYIQIVLKFRLIGRLVLAKFYQYVSAWMGRWSPKTVNFKKIGSIHPTGGVFLAHYFNEILRRLKTQVRKTKVPEDGICKYGIRKYESATVENVSTAT